MRFARPRPAHLAALLAATPLATCLMALALATIAGACRSTGNMDHEDTNEPADCDGMMRELEYFSEVLAEENNPRAFDRTTEFNLTKALDLCTRIRRGCSLWVDDEKLTSFEMSCAWRLGRYERVIETFDRYRSLEWSYPDAWRFPLASARASHAGSLPPQEAAAEFRKALALAEAILAGDPDDVRAHSVNARVLEGLGRTDDALVAYGEVAVRAGDDEELRGWALAAQARLGTATGVERAASQLARGEVDAALATLESALERDPASPRARGLRALARSGRFDEHSTDAEAILADCRAALESGCGTPRLAFLAAYLADRLGRPGEALPGYRAFLLRDDLAREQAQNVVFAAERRAVLAGLETGMGEVAIASSLSQLRPLRDRAAGGDVDALLELGALVEHGSPGLVPDVELATVWWTRAAEHPQSPSADAAWRLYRVDASLEQLDAWAALVADAPDESTDQREEARARAEAWLVRAGELGSPDACYELALRAEHEDPVESLAWALPASRAARDSLRERALDLVGRLELVLSVEERAEAELRAGGR